jgi:hypothetical protein
MPWLTATEALQVLGVRPQTLYANVSRKKIRAKPDPKDTRRSLYHETDVRKMARQHGGQRKATAVAAAAIEWGDPILSSGLSTVVDGRLYYRGQNAVVLAEEGTLEDVATILWGGSRLGDGDGRHGEGGGYADSGGGGGDQRDAESRRGHGNQHDAESAQAHGDRHDAEGGHRREDLSDDAAGREVLGPRGFTSASGHGPSTARDGKKSTPLQRSFSAPAARATTDLSPYGRGDPRDDTAVHEAAPTRDGIKSSPLQRAFLALGARAATDFSSYGRALPVLQAEAASVLVALADSM